MLSKNMQSLSASQKRSNELQQQQVALQNSLVQIARDQLDVQEQQLRQQKLQTIMQAVMLENSKIQTLLQEQAEGRRRRQQELRDAIFSVRDQIDKANSDGDPLCRYYALLGVQKEVNTHDITPNEFESIQDKEYAKNALEHLAQSISGAPEVFSGIDLMDCQIVLDVLPEMVGATALVTALTRSQQEVEGTLQRLQNTLAMYIQRGELAPQQKQRLNQTAAGLGVISGCSLLAAYFHWAFFGLSFLLLIGMALVLAYIRSREVVPKIAATKLQIAEQEVALATVKNNLANATEKLDLLKNVEQDLFARRPTLKRHLATPG